MLTQPIVEMSQPGGRPRRQDDRARFERFLLGRPGNSHRAGTHEPTAADAELVKRVVAADGLQTTRRIVELLESGRVPKNDPAIFSLAVAAKLGDDATRRDAYAALPVVCRNGSELMRFAEYAQRFGGWGRGMRKAVGAWFNARPAGELAYQLARYDAHENWSHRDLLRLAHPRAASPSHDRLFAWAVKRELPDGAARDPSLGLIVALDELRRTSDPHEAAELVRTHGVPRECVPVSLLRHPEVWEALLPAMTIPAILPVLPALTRVGLVAVGSLAAKRVARLLRDRDQLGDVHPLAILATLMIYRSGRGGRGQGPWLPVLSVVDALEAAFYTSLAKVAPTGKRMLVALDVSGSMASGTVAGVPGLTPRLATAAMALAAAMDHAPTFAAFTATATGGYGGKWGGGAPGLTTLSISSHQRLDDVVAQLGALPMGGIDCALPMLWAQINRVDVDTFVVYTDNETWAGDVHPAQALRAYRDARGIPAKLLVVGMTSNGFALADPDDPGMLDVIGFDPSTPSVLADFVRA